MSNGSAFGARWSYRSLHNNPDLAAEFGALAFGAGELVIAVSPQGQVTGSLGAPGWSLALRGRSSSGDVPAVRFQGTGEIGGESWVYDSHGFLAPTWSEGVDQRPAIIGTVIRTVAHSNGLAPAGYVGSFVAVKQD